MARDHVFADAALAGDQHLWLPHRRSLREARALPPFELPETTRVGEAGDPIEPIIDRTVNVRYLAMLYSWRNITNGFDL